MVHGFPRMPDPKTYLLRGGHTATLPNHKNDRRDVALAPVAPWPGAPLEPTGNPMLDGVGPGSYANREDVPELNIDNVPCIVPMRLAEGTYLEARDPDPRGMKVMGADSEPGGIVTDVWVDRAEALIRYLEVEVTTASGPRRVLLPLPFAKIDGRRGRVWVNAILGSQFADVPGHQEPRSGDQARGRPHRRLLRRRHALRHARTPGAAAVKQDFDQFKELPAPLPVGERVIWQGKPSFKGLALRSFHIREVAIYFGLLMAWKLWSNWSHGASLAEAATSVAWLVAPAVSAIAVLAGLAWLFRRAACLHHHHQAGAVSVRRGAADDHERAAEQDRQRRVENLSRWLGRYSAGALNSDRVSYVLLWPHVRPWRLRTPEPMLRALPDAALAAARLSEALTGQPGPAAVALPQSAGRSLVSDAAANNPSTVAA